MAPVETVRRRRGNPRKSVFPGALPQHRPAARRRRLLPSPAGSPGAYGTSRLQHPRRTRSSIPQGTRTRERRGRQERTGGSAGSFLFPDHGARRGHLHSQHRLHAQRAPYPRKLRPAQRTRGTKRSAGAGHYLLRGPVAARPVFFLRPGTHGRRHRQSADDRPCQRRPGPQPPAFRLAGGNGRQAGPVGKRRAGHERIRRSAAA